ncbi:MAG: TRAP transporter large permease [Pseudolysinimonas sp.]|uniref:TRAP transporter large permease n=1 Tax=Pseudolysinimonas sp. TaxID=2680009 RepID=UPI003C76863C
MILLLVVLGVLVLLAVRIPVWLALLIPSLVYFLLPGAPTIEQAAPKILGSLDSFLLVAVPLYVVMGGLANDSGVTDRVYGFAQAALARLRGSLAYVNVAASFGFAWMSGTAVADAAGLGKLEVTAMKRHGYDPQFAVGLTAASSLIGPVLPPSIPAVLYALTAGVSLGGMLIAGIGPALVITLGLVAYVWWRMRKRDDLRNERATPRQVARAALLALPGLVAPVILVGGILGGVFTPTESAAVAVAYMLLLGFVTRKLTFKALWQTTVSAAETTGAALLIVGTSAVFGYVVALEGGPRVIAEALTTLTDNPVIFLLIVNVFLLIAGTVLEPAAGLLILTPVLLPVAIEFGIDPLHFGVVMIFNLLIGLVTPPVGLILFALSSATGLSLKTVIRGTLPTFVPLSAALLVITYLPPVTLFLPRLLGF